MSEQTEVSFDAALMMALRADAQKELDELPTPAQLKERYPDTSRWDARLQAALHKRRPVLKRVLVAALTLVILTLGALAVSADFRKAVYTMIQKFLPIEMQLTYQVDAHLSGSSCLYFSSGVFGCHSAVLFMTSVRYSNRFTLFILQVSAIV